METRQHEVEAYGKTRDVAAVTGLLVSAIGALQTNADPPDENLCSFWHRI